MSTAEENHSDFPHRRYFPAKQAGRRKHIKAVEMWKHSHSQKKTCNQCSHSGTSTPMDTLSISGIEQVNYQTHFYYSFTFCSNFQSFYPFKL